MKNDLVNGTIAAGFALLVYWQAGRFAEGGASLYQNPAIYPRMLAAIVLAIGLILIGRAIAASRKIDGDMAQTKAPTGITQGYGQVATIGLFLFLYVGAIHLLGFIIPTMAFTLAMPIVLGAKLKMALLVSLPLTATLYVVFFVFFKVPIPSGILF